jgi:pyrimidine-nucleoside phosphorylase
MLEKFNSSYFDNVISLARKKQLKICDVVKLAKLLGESGDQLNLFSHNTIDIPSTGGPSSLSTLICPLMLVKMGKIVPKLGVKGRPAGGIDVLAQISNYKINFSLAEVEKILEKTNYCHFIADSRFAPLDSDFFKYRSDNNAKAIPELVIASILSKKVAVGVNEVGIDIRYFPGANFGETYDEAKRNGELFVEVAKQLGIKARYFLTDISNPLQPYIGRGEALLALKLIFENTMNEWLKEHYEECLKIALSFQNEEITDITIAELQTVFENNLIAQGSSFKAFLNKVSEIENTRRIPIYAPIKGILSIDLIKLRDIMVDFQNINLSSTFPDNIGIILNKRNAVQVEKGECIASLRIDNNSNSVVDSIKSAFHMIE